MKKLVAMMVLCSACVMGSAVANAQTAPAGGAGSARMEQMIEQLHTRFAAANTTHDGKLTQAQAQAGMPMVAKHFDEIDQAKAGYVTLAQIEEFMQQRAASR